jgi:hypothetical protein
MARAQVLDQDEDERAIAMPLEDGQRHRSVQAVATTGWVRNS